MNNNNNENQSDNQHSDGHNTQNGDQSAPSSGFTPYEQQPAFASSPPAQNGPLKHSGLGIAAFILALISVLLVVIGIVTVVSSISSQVNDGESMFHEITRLIEETGPDVDSSEVEDILLNSPEFESVIGAVFLSIFLVIGGLFISFIAFILGFISLFAKNKRKLFGIIGFALSLIIFGGTIITVVVGLAQAASL